MNEPNNQTIETEARGGSCAPVTCRATVMRHKEYLGDSVYAAIESGMIRLSTENGHGASNVIYLELEVFDALNRYVERIKNMYANQCQDAQQQSSPCRPGENGLEQPERMMNQPASDGEAERRLQALQPLLSEVGRRAAKENADWWKPNSGEAFEVTIDQEMWEQIKDAL